jgi:hypothetical protein
VEVTLNQNENEVVEPAEDVNENQVSDRTRGRSNDLEVGGLLACRGTERRPCGWTGSRQGRCWVLRTRASDQ